MGKFSQKMSPGGQFFSIRGLTSGPFFTFMKKVVYFLCVLCYNDHVSNTNHMYKFTKINYCHSPLIFGGGAGTETIVSWSRSPKMATSMRGTTSRTEKGDCECPQLTFTRLEKNGKVLFEGWED
jgi:hypothetical protein